MRIQHRYLLVALVAAGCQTEGESLPDAGAPVEGTIYMDDDDGEDPTDRCLDGTTGTLAVTSTPPIHPFESVTLTWKAVVPSNCTIRIYIGSTIVAKQGSMVVHPQANSTFRLRASSSAYGGGEKVLATRTITVEMPPVVTITANDQAPLFVQAVGDDDTTVVLQNHVQLDLSNRQLIAFGSNVTVRSERPRTGLEPGARIFTTTHPSRLFLIHGRSNVRITSLRIHGPDWNPGSGTAKGITIQSATNVHIDHNEFAGWPVAAIEVGDDYNTMGSPSPTQSVLPLAHTVLIYDNFIHHNQNGQLGYGVVSAGGAHPYIGRNTFDYNRHAISGDGSPTNGYTAIHNLVLENGGVAMNNGVTWHTHQFDMHGTLDCGWFSEHNCGPAGHTMLIRNNAFFYTQDEDIVLRGTPAVGMFVGQNVFVNHLSFDSAMSQEESGLVIEPGNEVVLGTIGNHRPCDLDGDGTSDQFLATGQNWWYRSAGTAPWRFLNASTRRVSELSFGNFVGDARCDIRSNPDNVVFSGGRPVTPPEPWLP